MLRVIVRAKFEDSNATLVPESAGEVLDAAAVVVLVAMATNISNMLMQSHTINIIPVLKR